jgi:flagellum-specific ATP synthase
MNEHAGLAGPDPNRSDEQARRLAARLEHTRAHRETLVVEGVLRRSIGLAMEAEGCSAALGGRCDVVGAGGERVETEVVGFSRDRLYLMPLGEMRGLVPNARVIPVSAVPEVTVGDDLLGRVLDGRGRPLDGDAPLGGSHRIPLFGPRINPLDRRPIREQLDVGVRSINALLTVGRGQRMGLFAGSGVGKSMLLGMMTRNTNADVVVVGLIGERGREVREFLETSLGAEGRGRAVVVATPADETPLMRMHGAWLSAAIAEYFRDRGKHVLLLMDSLTRFAQAQREIALAIGEPPATKGYPPSVFAKLPQLVERAGTSANGQGSITGFYTVLVEGDDVNDPIADASRAILDGHVALTRQLADAGVYPAIDIESSVSRTVTQLAGSEHQELISRFRQIYSIYQEHRDLIAVGAYRRGSDPRVDDAIQRWPAVLAFLKQRALESVGIDASVAALRRVVESPVESAGGELAAG